MFNDTDGLQLFQGYSLVDITATGVTRSADTDAIDRNQQRNWETVLQCIGLRTQPHNVQQPQCVEAEMDMFEFGDLYSGKQKIWLWTWTVDHSGVYDLPNKRLGGLIQDFEQVPIITGLAETAKFMLPIFYPHGAIKNIYFKQARTE
jgi:hypothetical protein